MAVTPAARTPAADVEVVVVEPRAIISWSSILAGALIALAVLVLLSVTALAAGLEVAPSGRAPSRSSERLSLPS